MRPFGSSAIDVPSGSPTHQGASFEWDRLCGGSDAGARYCDEQMPVVGDVGLQPVQELGVTDVYLDAARGSTAL